MSSLTAAVAYLFPGIDFSHQCRVVDRGEGLFIAAWNRPEPQPTQAEIDAAMLPAAKAQRIAAINAECRARLIARFGDAAEQISRSIGVYGATEQAALATGVAATIDASNTASNAVLAAADIAEVEAVSVSWPAI